MAGKRSKKKKVISGAVGGPAAGAGLDYQVNFAVLQCLEMISRALVNPLEQGEISMEPRPVTDRTTVTAWDVATSPPRVFTEAKLKPSRDEIIEWLGRVERGIKQSNDAEFQLLYSRGAGRLISSVERLCRVAIEAGGDRNKFSELVELESSTRDIGEVFNHLKSEPHMSLLRIRVTPFDQSTLEHQIRFFLGRLVSEPDRQRLHGLLFQLFHKALNSRITYKIPEIMKTANAGGIRFYPPPTFEPHGLDPMIAGAVSVLQVCEFGLPTKVLAAGLGCTDGQLHQALAQTIENGIISCDDSLWTVKPLESKLISHDIQLGRVLRSLLEYIEANKRSQLGWSQLTNAIALAKACETDHPELVASLFMKIDKLLKRLGNKRLVLEVAELSIGAAQRPNRTDVEVKGEAVALICGRSWVYQRIGRIGAARVDAEKSLKLGNEIRWTRNTAYCSKCISRLFRMEAEQNRQNQPRFRALLESSVKCLNTAIELFLEATELSETDRTLEVGDCYSLLGRTYLVGGEFRKADDAAREALKRLFDETSKDYADLQILLGDLELSKRQVDAAISFYDGAIKIADDADAEKSEIAARAWMRKGVATRTKQPFERAAEIWQRLEEEQRADEATWESIVLDGKVSAKVTTLMKDESPSVRLETLRIHNDRLASTTISPRGRRLEPSDRYWKELILDARRNIAVRQRDW